MESLHAVSPGGYPAPSVTSVQCGSDSGGLDPGGKRGAASPPPGGGSPGLVSLETSVTRGSEGSADSCLTPESITVFRHDGRLRRMRLSVQTSAELVQIDSLTGGFRCKAAMLTLTYRDDVPWEPGQVTALVRRVRQYLLRRGHPCRFVWVLELTRADRPHYHILFWLPRGLTLPKPDKQGWWCHGLTRIEWARSAVGYLIKYASKGIDGAALPKGARLCGSGGLSRAARGVRAWRLCPAWVREVFSVEDRPVRAPGGGWLSRLTGAFEPARWRLAGVGPGWGWVRLVPVGGVAPCPA